MNTFEQIKQIATTSPDGFTIHPKSLAIPTHGYAVAVQATQNSHGDGGLQSCIDHAINNNLFVGGWYDSSSNKFYYDSVRIVKTKKQALKYGKQQNQLAIFDLKRKQEIRL